LKSILNEVASKDEDEILDIHNHLSIILDMLELYKFVISFGLSNLKYSGDLINEILKYSRIVEMCCWYNECEYGKNIGILNQNIVI